MLTNQEHINNLVVNAYHREMEVYTYQVNIDNYSSMLTALPAGDWPADLSQWASTTVSDLPISMSDQDVETITDYQYRDRLRSLLRSERAEQNKAQRVLVALKSQIGSNADQLIADYRSSLSNPG